MFYEQNICIIFHEQNICMKKSIEFEMINFRAFMYQNQYSLFNLHTKPIINSHFTFIRVKVGKSNNNYFPSTCGLSDYNSW